METSELLKRAWKAVEDSGVPESIQEAAFHEAVADLRPARLDSPVFASSLGGDRPARKPRPRKPSAPKTTTPKAGEAVGSVVDESAFFAQLADESGLDEKDLRDVLSVAGDNVLVTPPTRMLGSNTSEQAKTVIALVAGARAFGLAERPVDAKAVRAELNRKRCFQSRKFAERHLGPLHGFNAGADSTQIVTTSRWVGEFTAAVNQALGRASDEGPG
ncbi:MAG TPA: hypothetical protein VM690_01500 [Gaiellaceae bacterium]|nr:hypothetical protein [Gaiellaceae bacterium]